MRRALTITFLLLLPAMAPAEIRQTSFESKSLGRSVACTIQLPPSYATSQARYPVVYALHGLFEDSGAWQSRGLDRILDGLWSKGDVPELVVVAVDGGNSFFVNSPAGAYEDLVTKEAVAYAEGELRVTPGRATRGLLGVSMGGYAALRIALRHPESFGAVAAHSAMVLTAIPRGEDGARRGHMDAFHRIFGDPIDPRLWEESDPLVWAGRVDPAAAPRLYFDCGDKDRYGLFAGNEALHQRLQARGVAHEFSLQAGDHGYDYVRTVLARSLGFLGHALTGR
jgi:S-formylglutathione hydrolase FrmB